MTDRVRKQVLGYLLGVLDDSEMEEVRARLESDPAYRQAMRGACGNLKCLRGLQRSVLPPPRLAERTCEFLFDPTRRLRCKAGLRPMTPSPAGPQAGNRLNWADVVVAAAIFLIAGLLVLPAISGTRFQARVSACQNNLRQVGQALTEYSHKNHDVFPEVPSQGHLAAAGIWAPMLKEKGYLAESEQVLCPESEQAHEKDFQIPSLDELRKAVGQELSRIQQKMGGSYGYGLGYLVNGSYHDTRNLNREYFVIMADAPSPDRPDHQSMNHGGVGQNMLFEDLHIEFSGTPRIGNDEIYSNDNHEVAPGLHRDDAVVASSGTSPVVFISIP
jgi:hypothetical protein